MDKTPWMVEKTRTPLKTRGAIQTGERYNAIFLMLVKSSLLTVNSTSIKDG